MYRLAAEWQNQQGVILSFPHPHTDFAPILEEAYQCFFELLKALSLRENVFAIAFNEQHAEMLMARANKSKVDLKNVSWLTIPTNDIWVRDYGPIRAINDDHRALWLNHTFNAWGDKYEASADNAFNDHFLVALNQIKTAQPIPFSLKPINLVTEGGALESNGHGTLMLRSSTIIDSNRNALSQEALELELKEHLGVEEVILIHHGHLAGDDTDGHIDTLARFVDQKTIIHHVCTDSNDEHHLPLKLMTDELKSLPFDNIEAPIPPACFNKKNQRLPASYMNFLIGNQAVYVPTYGFKKEDNNALAIIQEAFPRKDIIGVYCRALIEQYGSLHCATRDI